jgi:hypothetical protein
VSQSFGLDVVYHSRYFYVMCCGCGDDDGYTSQHKNARQKYIQVAIYVNNKKINYKILFPHQ